MHLRVLTASNYLLEHVRSIKQNTTMCAIRNIAPPRIRVTYIILTVNKSLHRYPCSSIIVQPSRQHVQRLRLEMASQKYLKLT